MTEEKTLLFLYKISENVGQVAERIEKQFFNDPQSVLVNGRLILEEILKLVYEKEGQFYYENLTLQERIDKIGRLSDIDDDVIYRLHLIRKSGNKGAHNIVINALNQALVVHRNLYEIGKWYLEVFGDDVHFMAPPYQEPKPPIGTTKEEIELLVKSELEKMFQQNKDEPKEEEKETFVQTLVKRDGKENKSFLVKQLRRLEESSKEAVEGLHSFSHFKEYMHVEREIQQELLTVLEETHCKNNAQLILLCGSVGDGKSHLLSYLNVKHSNVFKYFSVHNDATESFDPTKNSLDTLADVLYEFNDEQISTSSKKLILAINLGVLNNFLESKYARHFTKLKKFILQTNVFDGNKVVQNNKDIHFNLLSFSDYHLFELTNKEPHSKYFSELLMKITARTEENPFYIAYQLDRKNLEKNYPVLVNYEWLQKKQVQEGLIQLLIRATIQYKLIISTRTLLNFIHDILVPPSLFDVGDMLTPKQIIETNILYLLFQSKDRSQVLKVIHELDPIHIRNQQLDELLIELNGTTNVLTLATKYFNDHDVITFVESIFSDSKDKQNKYIQLDEFFIRLAFFFISDLKNVFYSDVYRQYLIDLYHYNKGELQKLLPLYRNIIKIIYEWKGTPEKDYMYIEQLSKTLWMAQKVMIVPKPEQMNKRVAETLHRFTENIFVFFESNGETVKLELDYPLYELIQRLLMGYRPNKKDKEDAIKFVECIESILRENYGAKEVVFYHLSTNKHYVLNYTESFGTYEFGRKL